MTNFDTVAYLKSLHHQVTEVRILRESPYLQLHRTGRGEFVGKTVFGYYDNQHYDKLVADIQPYQNDPETKGIYTTIQRCDPALLARAENRLKQAGDNSTTSDGNITHFVVFPIDVDSGCASGISATEAELQASKIVAGEIAAALQSLGIPVVKAISGNGWHIPIYLAEPLLVTEDTTIRFKRCGDVIVSKWGGDATVYNPARIWKLYGTTAKKGDSTPDRPHRQAKILEPTDLSTIERISFDDLEKAILSLEPAEPTTTEPDTPSTTPARHTNGKRLPPLNSRDDLERLARDCGAELQGNWQQKPDYEACKTNCPLCHRDKCGVITYSASGECGYKCHTNTCGNANFQSLYESAGYVKAPEQTKSAYKGDGEPPIDCMGSNTPQYTDDDIELDSGENVLMEFPQELFFGVFKDYREAHLDRVPISDAFAFASLKHTIASILGRKIYLDTAPLVFPNMYTAFIGGSSDSAKGNALRQSREMLRASAPNVLTLSGLATPEGLLNQFVKPKEKENEDEGTVFLGGFADGINNPERIRYILDDMCDNESPRVAGYFGEFGSVLRKAAKMNATGLLELIMQLYDAEDDNDSPTKTNRTVAEYPTFSMLAATDLRLIETVLQDAYISGGFTNRFEWYLGKRVKKRFLNKTKDQTHWNNCVQEVGKLRDKFGEGKEQIAFGITNEAYDLGQSFTDELGGYLNSETMSDTMIADSLKRTDMHVLKNALIFSVILNKPEDRTIGCQAVELAIQLAEFTTHCTRLIFKDFATTVNKQVEDKILNYLRKNPKSTLGVIANRTRVDMQTLEKALDALVRTHRVVRIKGERKPQFAVIKSEVL